MRSTIRTRLAFPPPPRSPLLPWCLLLAAACLCPIPPGAALCRDEGLTLAISELPSALQAGTSAPLWLTALNLSNTPARWSPPEEIVCRLTCSSNTVEVPAQRTGRTTGTPTEIAPGHFARAEYSLPLPRSLTGEAVIEFPTLALNRIAIVLTEPPTESVAAKEPLTFWERALRDAEPEEAGTPWSPGRFFKEHIFGYEPFYFIAGTESPNAKFQISFKYRFLNETGALADKIPPLTGLHLAYTQASLWDWSAPSAPFYDSSYKPEFLYSWDRVVGGDPTHAFRLDLQGGLQHESNGKDGPDSRSLNILYLRPTVTLGRQDSLQLTLIPRVWAYIGDLEDNPDLEDYRGYGDLRAVLGWKRGLQVSALGRIGDDGEHGSLQVDVTYPMMRLLSRSLGVYFHLQYFTGYGESLLDYDQSSSVVRVGISLYR